nr:dephospho-CoA kinase [Agromyces seonyuensis]
MTGGIASGKSTVARRLYQHGAVVIDADELARKVVQPGTPVLAKIAEEFGEGVLHADGSLDRGALAAVVFHDPEALARLNAITHPAVRELALRCIAEAGAADPDAIVVYDVPLLAEGGTADSFDFVIVTDAPRKTQLARLVDERGLDPVQAAARIDAQIDRESRNALADAVIDTDGRMAATMSQVDALWPTIVAARDAKRSA